MVGVITSRNSGMPEDYQRVSQVQRVSYAYPSPVYNQSDGGNNGSKSSNKTGLEGLTIEGALKLFRGIVNGYKTKKDEHSLMGSQEFIEAEKVVVTLLDNPNLDTRYVENYRRDYRNILKKARVIEESLFMERKSRLARKIGMSLEHYHPKESRGRRKGENTFKEPASTTIGRPR